MSKTAQASQTDILIGDVGEAKGPVKKEIKFTPPTIGRIVHLCVRGVGDGEMTIQPAIVVKVKGTSADLQVFCGTFTELRTKVPQSEKAEPGFWFFPPRV